MLINNNEIKIYFLYLNKSINNENQLEKFLSKDELIRANNFKFDRDRFRFIHSRAILKKKLSDFLHVVPSTIKLTTNKYQKPIIDIKNNDPKINFNVSHTDDLILYAFCFNCVVGIDIEKINFKINHIEIAENYFSKDEIIYLKSSKDQFEIADRFFRVWTRKEAVLKAFGTGLVSDLKKIDILQKVVKLNFFYLKLPNNQNKIFSVIDIPIDTNYKSALAYSGNKKSIKIEEINI